MATKMTHKDFYNNILSKYPLTSAEKDFIKGRIEALDKKANSAKAKAKTDKNAALKSELIATMEYGEKYTITEMLKMFPCCAELTNQKVSAAMRSLIESGEVERTESKGKAYFELATPSAEEEE
jgi:hypothetical protein